MEQRLQQELETRVQEMVQQELTAMHAELCGRVSDLQTFVKHHIDKRMEQCAGLHGQTSEEDGEHGKKLGKF